MLLHALALVLNGMLAAPAADAAPCTHIDLHQIKVGGEIGRRIQATVDNNLLVMDLDRDFLAPFQSKSSQDGYVGLGKNLDAFARFAAYTGDPRVIERKQRLVQAILECQEQDGYLGMMRPEARVKSLWDVHEMSYLVLGLTTDYECFGEKNSLDAARRLADYLIDALSAQPRPQVGPADLSAIMGTTGLDEALLLLTEQCGDTRYRDFVVQVRELPRWRMPLVLGRWGKIEGHAYAYMAECLAQLRLNRVAPDPGLWESTEGVFRFLLDEDGLVISGVCSDHECWHNTQSGTTNLGETCATAYLLRLCDEVLLQTGNPLCGDLMERVLHNALLGAQSPDGRNIRYYTPFEAPRAYHPGDTYCCPNNYRRILSEVPQMNFYRRDGGVLLNLYTPGSAILPVAGDVELSLREDTTYPADGTVKLHLTLPRPATFPIFFRVPRWCNAARVLVNGEETAPGTTLPYLGELRREWKDGDTVELQFPIEVQLVKGRRTQAGRAAIMRGPLLFTFAPNRNQALTGMEPRLLTLDTASVQGPFPDDSVHPGGLALRAKVWAPGAWYPGGATQEILLTEFADPESTATYFHVPNPNDERLREDELIGSASGLFGE